MEQVELPQLLACPEQVALLQITLNRTPNGSCNFVLARSAPRPAEKLPALSRRRKKGAGCSVGQISFYVLPCEHFFWRGIVALLYPDAKPPKQILTCGKSVHNSNERLDPRGMAEYVGDVDEETKAKVHNLFSGSGPVGRRVFTWLFMLKLLALQTVKASPQFLQWLSKRKARGKHGM